jgi:hypothetical protein
VFCTGGTVGTHDAEDGSMRIAVARGVRIPAGVMTFGYKAVQAGRTYAIAVLAIPSNTRTNMNESKKCRAGRATVVVILPLRADGTLIDAPMERAQSMYDSRFTYRAGIEHLPTNGFGGGRDECAPGIHFFLSPSDASRYVISKRVRNPEVLQRYINDLTRKAVVQTTAV